jgi:hypothetical protein
MAVTTSRSQGVPCWATALREKLAQLEAEAEQEAAEIRSDHQETP